MHHKQLPLGDPMDLKRVLEMNLSYCLLHTSQEDLSSVFLPKDTYTLGEILFYGIYHLTYIFKNFIPLIKDK